MIREPLESLGDSITSAVLLSWSKKPGDNIKEDDVICIVETDKVTMDIRAKRSGVFVESLTTEGAEVCYYRTNFLIDSSSFTNHLYATIRSMLEAIYMLLTHQKRALYQQQLQLPHLPPQHQRQLLLLPRHLLSKRNLLNLHQPKQQRLQLNK